VRNRKVEFNPECCPCATVADPGFLDRWIGVEHRLSADFVYARIYMPANIGQYGTLQIFIFQIDRSQLMVAALFRNLWSQRVGIVEAVGGELIKRGIRRGRSLFIDWQIENAFPDSYLRPNGKCRYEQEQERGLPSHRFHLGEYRSAISLEDMPETVASLARLLRIEEGEQVKVPG
jgi:hypothetical protein